MIVVAAGSRSFYHYAIIQSVFGIWCPFEITELWHGDQGGVKVNGVWHETVDRLAARWARSRGIPVKAFPAPWNEHGRQAGPIRNARMARAAAEVGAALVSIWDGRSRGTAGIRELFRIYKLPQYPVNIYVP